MVFSESSDEDEPKVAKKMAKTASHGLSDDEDFKTQVPQALFGASSIIALIKIATVKKKKKKVGDMGKRRKEIKHKSMSL